MWACVAKVGGLSLLSDKLNDGFKISLWSSCHSFLSLRKGWAFFTLSVLSIFQMFVSSLALL